MRANVHSIGFIVSGAAMFLTIGILVFGSREPIHAPHQEANTPVSELRLDLQDLTTLMAISQRPSVRTALSSQAKRVERQIDRQETLISDGDRLYAAAIRHLGGSPHLAQAKLKISAAKSAYQRAAAADKVESASNVEETIAAAERAMAERAAARGLDPGEVSAADARELLAAIRLPAMPNQTAPVVGAAALPALNATLQGQPGLKAAAAGRAGDVGGVGAGGGGDGVKAEGSNASKPALGGGGVPSVAAQDNGGRADPAAGPGGGKGLKEGGLKLVGRGLFGPERADLEG